MFLVTGAVLLTVGYVLVRHNLRARPNFGAVRHELGLPAVPRVLHAAARLRPGLLEYRAVARGRQGQFASDTLHRLLIEYVVALVVMTAISVAAGWVLAGRALAPLRAITATARRVSGENLGERIDLTVLPTSSRSWRTRSTGCSSGSMRRSPASGDFVANASHELRTPLAIMRTEVDVALADPNASVAELRAMGEAVRETVDRSEGLIEALLLLARSEATSGREEPIDLAELAGGLHHRPAGAVRAVPGSP